MSRISQPMAALRRTAPLVHCISNIVTAGDCANLLLAAGARAIMAQEAAEMPEIVALSAATVLNTGTPGDAKWEACLRAGLAANECGHPLVLDPVGAGASAYRRQHLQQLTQRLRFTAVRCNYAEAQALLRGAGGQSGVEGAARSDESARRLAAALAQKLQCVVLLSGAEDIVTDGQRLIRVAGGSARMARITGAGCMLSALLGGVLTSWPDPLQAAVSASAFWKSCSGWAQQQGGGAGSFHAALFDAAEQLDLQQMEVWTRCTEQKMADPGS